MFTQEYRDEERARPRPVPSHPHRLHIRRHLWWPPGIAGTQRSSRSCYFPPENGQARHPGFYKHIIHLGELHLIHALASVPVEEGLAPEHGGELLRDPLEQLLRRDTFIHRTRTEGSMES